FPVTGFCGKQWRNERTVRGYNMQKCEKNDNGPVLDRATLAKWEWHCKKTTSIVDWGGVPAEDYQVLTAWQDSNEVGLESNVHNERFYQNKGHAY
ncbi:MAG: hypothetical protein ACRDHN_16180, partial [Thermomicrobiales bacterium]